MGKTQFRAEQERQAWWNDKMALREHIGRVKDPKKIQPSDEIAAESAKKDMVAYLRVKDKENVLKRKLEVKEAIRRYGIEAVRKKLAERAAR